MDAYTYYKKIDDLLEDVSKCKEGDKIKCSGDLMKRIDDIFDVSFREALSGICKDQNNLYSQYDFRKREYIIKLPDWLELISEEKETFKKDIILATYYNLRYFAEYELKNERQLIPEKFEELMGKMYEKDLKTDEMNYSKVFDTLTKNLKQDNRKKLRKLGKLKNRKHQNTKPLKNRKNPKNPKNQKNPKTTKNLLKLKFYYIESYKKNHTSYLGLNLNSDTRKLIGITCFCEVLTFSIILNWHNSPWNSGQRPPYYERYSYPNLKKIIKEGLGYEYYFLFENITGFQLATIIYNSKKDLEIKDNSLESEAIKQVIPILTKMPNIYGRQQLYKKWINSYKIEKNFSKKTNLLENEMVFLADLYSDLFWATGYVFIKALWKEFITFNKMDTLVEVSEKLDEFICSKLKIKKDVIEEEHSIYKEDLLEFKNTRSEKRRQFADIQKQIIYDIANQN